MSEIKLVFPIPPERPTPNFPPGWNVAPTDPLPVVRLDPRAGERSLDLARWGLVPFWAKTSTSASRISTPRARGSRTGRPSAKRSRGGGASCLSITSMSGRRSREKSSPMPLRLATGA
ncbi:MAG: SOS response-associated peptidase family protein [Alphaproteobacteria bacterium]|nr:SOS response-associated peptidase family protein [Alphaproteobacteria bacterium]